MNLSPPHRKGWHSVTALPPERGRIVECLDPQGKPVRMRREGSRWFLAGEYRYAVWWKPKWWRHVEQT